MALQLPDSPPREAAAPIAVSETDCQIRALDWPCWEAPSLREAWDRLALCAAEPNPFLESWHLLPALRALDPGETVQLLMFEAGGQLAGMVPIVRRKRLSGKRKAHLALWNHPDCRHGAPMVAAGREVEFWQALLTWTDGWGRYGNFLHLGHLVLDGPLHRALESVLAAQNRPARETLRDDRPLLAAGETPEAYFAAALDDAEREDIGGKLARLAGQGELTFDRTETADGLAEWIDRFLELDAANRGDAPDSAGAKLCRQQLEGAAGRGRLERLTLVLDGRAIAMLANLLAPPGAFAYRTASDGVYADFDPGVLLHCENLLILDRADLAWTDCGTLPRHPAIDRLWRERRTMRSVSVAIGGKLRRTLFARRLGAG